jgi:signal transduction histidine kinase
MNLVTNANEAIGSRSGVISIATGVMNADQEYLYGCYGDHPKPGRYAYIEINDTGCGMDAETIEKIFDR